MKLPSFFTRINGDITKQTLQLFRTEAAHEKRTVILVAILIPFGNFLYIVLLPLLISFLTESLITQPHNIITPLYLLAGMAAIAVATVLVNHVGMIKLFLHEERVTTRLTERAMRGLLAHSHGFFANRKVGSLAGDVNTFSRSYLIICDILALQASSIIVNFATSLLIVAFIAPALLVPLIAVTAYVVIASVSSLKQRAPLRNERKRRQSKLFGTIADILGNNTLVRLFGKASYEVDHIVNERQSIERIAKKEIDLIQSNADWRQGVLQIAQIIILGIAIYLITHDMLGIGALIFIITYLGRVFGSMFGITSIIRGIEQALLDAANITEILAETPTIQDDVTATALNVQHGSITFDNVHFAYPDSPKKAVFDQLNLTIPDGQRVGLVGHSGGGKTTLTSLLLRYADITSGSITIDDQNISRVTQASLRNAMSYVPQESYLFHRSLRENVTYGVNDTALVDDDTIWQALEQANALDFVSEMPQGLDTIVGERGIKLSGGQRQRIAIARAILKDAPILVLDEATSALDSESEKLIQDSLDNLMVGRTSIVIAHRLSTIAKLDRIIVLDHGVIVEDGSHNELIQANGTYARLWKRQSGGFIDE